MNVNTKLTTFEVFALTNMLLVLMITDTRPIMFAQKTQNAFWLVPAVSFLFMLPPVFIILFLMHKHKAVHLVDLLEKLLGKFVGKTIAALLFIMFFFTLAFEKRGYVDQIKLLYFEQSTIFVMFGLLTIICVFGAVRGIKVIGYTAKMFIPYLKISVFTLIILIIPSLVPVRVYPIFGSGLPQIIKEGFLKGSVFSSFFLLLMILPAVQKAKHFYKGALIGLVVSVAEIILFFFIFTSFFDYKSLVTTPYPFNEITQYVSLGDFFTNLDALFLVFWLVSMFIRIILLLYLMSWLFGATFNIKSFELLTLPLSFLLMVVGLLPSNTMMVESFYRNQIYNLSTFIMVGFPFILLFSHFLRRIKG